MIPLVYLHVRPTVVCRTRRRESDVELTANHALTDGPLYTHARYVGELGYELFVPAEFAVHLYDRIVEAGLEFGLVHAGP